MKIVTVVGNRPQFIKLSALHKELKDDIIIYTGQHYSDNMSKVFFKEFGIKPDYSLNARSIGDMINRITDVLETELPDLVIVYGDTNSTLAGAISASQLKIPVAHVEAGLRCYDKTMPEENNRVMVDHLSTYLFCPTAQAVENLKKEGIIEHVYPTGDVMTDLIKDVKWEPKDYVLATIHRQANVDDKERLNDIMGALRCYPRVIMPLHPRTRKRIEEFQINTGNIELREPVNFHKMIELERHAQLIVTDSGGVQREAYLIGMPCVVFRDFTEWEELKTGFKGLLGGGASKKIADILGGL